MFDFLRDIWHVVSQLGCWVLWALESAVNLLIAGIAAAAAAALSILPGFPDMPELPATLTTVLGWIAWVWPVDTTLTIIGTLLGLWLAWQLVAVVLRWAKAVS